MLSDFLTIENIIFNMESSEKEESFAELLEVLLQQDNNINRDSAMNALIERENKMSTAVLPHIAVPHAVCNSIEFPVISIGISKRGIPFESIDKNCAEDNQVNIIFEILFNESDTQLHLHILRDVLRLISNPDFYQNVMKAENVHEILELIRNIED